MAVLEQYALIGCVDQETSESLPGIFLSPPIKVDAKLLQLLALPPEDLHIEFDHRKNEHEIDIEVSIKKRFQEEPKLEITFSSSQENYDAFDSLLRAAGKCWLIWRGEGFQFFACFDPIINVVDKSEFELLQ